MRDGGIPFVLTERVDGESERVREKENQRIAILTEQTRTGAYAAEQLLWALGSLMQEACPCYSLKRS
jgi:hypothetical protein